MPTTTAADVSKYYDDLFLRRMVDYRIDGNIRLAAAAAFFKTHTTESSTVVDIGCGIGITSEAMGRRATSGFVIGLDISDKNIWYASKTVRLTNVHFCNIDIIDQADTVRALLDGRAVDLFTLADVIEHIEEARRLRLFQTMSELGSDDIKILITIPTEFYQRYLMQENREELQIIDNVVTPTLLETEGRMSGFTMTYFRVIDMWQRVQYAHCVLERKSTLMRRVREQHFSASPGRITRFGRRVVNRFCLRPLRQRRYVTSVFPDSTSQ